MIDSNIIRWTIFLIGVGVIIDGLGSIYLPENKHKFILDLERAVRSVGGIIISILIWII